jgi:hypothetical protein
VGLAVYATSLWDFCIGEDFVFSVLDFISVEPVTEAGFFLKCPSLWADCTQGESFERQILRINHILDLGALGKGCCEKKGEI